MSEVLWLGLALLVVAAGAVVRLRMRSVKRRDEMELTDDMVRQIEEEGRLETDRREPLDYDEIRREEDRFWSESWDEPEDPVC